LQHLRSLPTVKKDKIFLYGGSRGPVIASVLSTQDSQLAGVILKSGVYDMGAAYRSYSWFNLIKLKMIWEFVELNSEMESFLTKHL
jgi:hypothetical protein